MKGEARSIGGAGKDRRTSVNFAQQAARTRKAKRLRKKPLQQRSNGSTGTEARYAGVSVVPGGGEALGLQWQWWPAPKRQQPVPMVAVTVSKR